jgi:hypothetical protein
MAANLARSFFWWHPDTDIIFRIVTDNKAWLPVDVLERVEIITIVPGEFGLGFSTKLHLDKLSVDGQSLFIDSDCLVYGNLDFVFEKFKEHSVSVIGNYIATGEWFGDIGAICKQFNIQHMPKFNGGIYYLEKGKIADEVFQTARSLEKRYDEIGFVRLRDRPNDEVLMALAMELHLQAPIDDDGSILAEFVNFQSGVKSDLLNGVAELYNDPGNPAYQEKWHLTLAQPAIVHFLGYHNQVMPYIKEVKQLKYVLVNKLPQNVAKFLTFMQVTLPFESKSYLKKTLRPLYHSLFGTRKIKTSERVILND